MKDTKNGIITKSIRGLSELREMISSLSNDEFNNKIEHLDNSFIGEHCRHILEFFEELLSGYDLGVINYDKRKRDQKLQTLQSSAILKIDEICAVLDKPDKTLKLQQTIVEGSQQVHEVDTNYYRELVYNIEHTVHHKALIRVAFNEQGILTRIQDNFGYADSTLIHKGKAASA